MASARDIAVWERMVATSGDDLPADAARGILRLTFSERDLRRMTTLSEKGSDLPLLPSEQAELENYATVSRILGLMHSRARLALGSGRTSAVKSRRKTK